MGINRVRSVTRVCEQCGNDYHPWRANRPSHFCSHECAQLSGRPGAKRKHPDRICEQCGIKFRSLSTLNASRFCTRQCYLDSNPRIPQDNGYVLVYDKDYSTRSNGQIFEHRLIMSRFLGRHLESYETVHHINGDRADNRLENLQLRIGKHGNGIACRCRNCGSIDIEAIELVSGG